MELRESTSAEAAEWESGWRARLGADDPTVPDRRARADERPVFVLSDEGRDVGYSALARYTRDGSVETRLFDVYVDPAHRRRGHARAALAHAATWARERGARTLQTAFPGEDAATLALFADWRLQAQHMARDLDRPTGLPAGVAAARLSGADFDGWMKHSIEEYARINVAAGLVDYDQAYRRSVKEFGELLPRGAETSGHSIHRLTADGEAVADIWVKHGFEPGTSFVFDVETAPGHRGRGYGRAAMNHGENLALEHGDERMMLNVHGHNTVAINLYEKLGYTVVRRFLGLDLGSA